MKHVYYPDVEGLDSLSLGVKDSAKMLVKLMSDDSVCIELEPKGHTPDHAHKDKERIVVMSGKGEIKAGEERIDIKSWDFVEIDSEEEHQIRNNSDELLVLMCFRNQQ